MTHDSFTPPIHFTVSQIRLAAACPRIIHFDAVRSRTSRRRTPQVTQLWQGPAGATAGGALFHAAVEKFNRLAYQQPVLRTLIAETHERDELFRGIMRWFNEAALNRDALYEKSAELIVNFTNCVETYLRELTDIIHFGRQSGREPEDIVTQLFAPLPKKVDVTLHVGPNRQPVHVTGALDYVFFDWRSRSMRILDYKLTPAESPHKDQIQVATYALLYHHQHQYQCDAGVFYLFPERNLVELTWQDVYAQRHLVYDLLASMVAWSQYDAAAGQGLHPPGDETFCESCSWRTDCVDRLGPKSQGESYHGWSESQNAPEPVVEVQTPKPDAASVPTGDTEEDVSIPPLPPPPKAMIHLGQTVAGHDSIEFPVSVLSTHTAIVGAAGSGKTWLAKCFLEEAIRNQIPVLAIDPQGDLVQFLYQRDESELPEEERTRYREFRNLVEPRIYTPGTSHATRLSLSPMRLPRMSDLEGLPEARREEEFTALINAVAMHLVGLTARGRSSVEQQQTFVAMILKRLVDSSLPSANPLSLTDIAAAVHAPEGIGFDDVDMLIKKSDRENLGRQLYALAHGPLARLFSGGETLDIDSLRKPTTNGKVPLNVLYLNALTEEEKHAFLAAVATEVYRWMSCTGGDPEHPQFLFFLDEARDFLPAGSKSPPAKGPVSRLFTQGRKFGVGCVVCTQSPRSVDYNVFGNCSTKIIGRLETSQDSERVGEWFSTAGPKPDWVADRAGADQGTFVARWPDQPDELDGAVFKSRILYSRHEGAWSIDRVEEEVARSESTT
ncbi:MAG: DUF853 family protein [Planctomycetaceae bacterium]|nr:DUF853 family protein [Planctomycetaceae bacterium]